VTLLAAEILKELRPYVEEGVGVHTIIKGLRRGSELVSVVDMR
jgi:T-complex protein 1 subunit eta